MSDINSGNMSKWTSLAWALFLNGIVLALIMTLYTITWEFQPDAASPVAQVGAAIWLGVLITTGVRIVRKPQFWVIERFGQFKEIKYAGFRVFLLLGIVDTVVARGTFARQRFELYEGDIGGAIDFADGGSAPVRGDAWYEIYDPALWTYAYDGDSITRVQQIVDGFIRPMLQSLTLSEARTEKGKKGEGSLGEELGKDEGVRTALAEIGVRLDPEKPFILSDIILPADVVEAFKKQLVAEILANADEERGRGVSNAIVGIMRDANNAGSAISYEEATNIFINRTSLSTLEGLTNANFTFVSPDVGGVTKTFEVGKSKGGS